MSPAPSGTGPDLPDNRPRRRVALAASAATALVMLAVTAITGGLTLWLVLAAAAAVAAAGLAASDRAPATDSGRRTRTGERLAAAEALLANIPDPVILVDRRIVVREANPAAVALLPGLKVRSPLSFALRAPDVLDGIATVLRTGHSLRVEYAERVPTERVFEVQIGPLERDPGAQGVVLFFRDLTSARRLEHMRVDFVANASHELRTPLASLLGFIETLQGPARNDAAARERFLDIMREQAQRMRRLIDDLLSLSRIELRVHLVPETSVDFAAVVRQIVDAMAPSAKERGTVIVAEVAAPLEVQGDRDELLRVVENLVENAVKYGDGGGRVEVGLVRVPAEGDGEVARLTVRDFGPGIAPEHLPRLTERFYRVDVATSREKGGTGLGLAIVKHIVAHHRGRLAIASEPGEGATFTVDIPAVSGAMTATE